MECDEIQVFDPRDGGTLVGFADPDGNTWAVQQPKARRENPLIPHEHRARSGEDAWAGNPRLRRAVR